MNSVRRHWVRVEMYRAAADIFRATSHELDVLEISGDASCDLLPWKKYTSAVGVDVCALDWPPASHDLVILDQVLEHVVAPLEALVNVGSVLRPGGRIFVATPFLIRYHPDPIDFWRWTAEGLAHMLRWAGFADVSANAWGNRACVIANLKEWALVPAEGPGPNEPLFPVTVWAVGTRPR
jgi:SAM-dependent methyltransferase